MVDADGANRIHLEQSNWFVLGRSDWQPLPINTYVRPKGATPVLFALVPAYRPCTTPNRAHAPPLAHDSCNPAQLETPNINLGVGDGNPAPSKCRAPSGPT